MSRSLPFLDSDSAGPDDLIPRVQRFGVPAEVMRGGPSADARLVWPPAFAARVNAAMVELRRGDAEEEVQGRHGAVVLKQAQREVRRVQR